MIPTFLSDLVRTIIIMSISGGGVALLLFAIKPFTRHRLPKAAQYYFWLVVLAALLIPVSRFVALPSTAINAPSIQNTVERNVISINEETGRFIAQQNLPMPAVTNVQNMNAPAFSQTPYPAPVTTPPEHIPPAITVLASTFLMLAYPWVVLLVLAYNLIGYAWFTRKLRRGYLAPHEQELAILRHLSDGRTPRLYFSKYAATPMLIGLFRPTIVLPDNNYTHEQLHSIFIHELVHMRRHDIAVKWLTLIACAIHWFNPVVWFVRREIDRVCELACDEAVILHMDNRAKQNYGDTLISVATDTKIPMPVLSTTMCEEKRALKERLSAIMRSKQHTKAAVFASGIIILVATLAACTLGAGRNAATEEYEEETYDPPTETIYSTEYGANTPLQFAQLHIDYVAENMHPSPYVRVAETRINTFEMIASFDHILPRTLELWYLDFAIRAEELNDQVRWGTFTPDEDGWVHHYTAFNEARTYMVFFNDEYGIRYFGHAPTWFHFILPSPHTPWGAELFVRAYLESEGLIPPVTFPDSDHMLVYIDLSDQGFHIDRLLMSQPFGPDGIWVVDRWQSLTSQMGHMGEQNIGHWFPLCETRTMMEYYAYLQQALESGRQHLADPLAVAEGFVQNWQAGNILGIFPAVSSDNPLADTPFHVPPVIPEFQCWGQRDFWGYEPLDLIREQLIEEHNIGFDQAYHFRVEGFDHFNYALITGWRPLTTAEEIARYVPHSAVPAQVGNYRLVSLKVDDRTRHSIIVCHEPIHPDMYGMISFFHNETNLQFHGAVEYGYEGRTIPLDEVFTRYPWQFSFLALYADDDDNHVALGLYSPPADMPSTWEWWDSPYVPPRLFSTVDMGQYGTIYFGGEDTDYRVAIYERPEFGIVVELAYVNPEYIHHLSTAWWFWPSGISREPQNASREDLENLVRLFDPAELFRQNRWQMAGRRSVF